MDHSVSVFEYVEPREYLSQVLVTKQKTNPRFSLRAWSKQIGFSSPSLLSMVLKGQRRLKPAQAVKVRKVLELKDQEARYFDFLVLYSNASSLEEKEFYTQVLKTLKPDSNFSTLELDKFRLISDWYHMVILEMVKLKDFKDDPLWISKKLEGHITSSQIKDAIERLIRLNLLTKNKKGRLERVHKRLSTPTDFPHEGIKKFHHQMIQKALTALEDQDIHERDITANSMTTSLEKIPEAKKRIRDFRQNLAKFLDTPNGDCTYQLNAQLFRLTRR